MAVLDVKAEHGVYRRATSRRKGTVRKVLSTSEKSQVLSAVF